MKMKSVSDQRPCRSCKYNQQVGNPDVWQSPCYNCDKMIAWRGVVYARLLKLESILGPEYDTDDLEKFVREATHHDVRTD